MKEIIENSLKKTLSYKDYRALVSNLLAEGKSTGPEQSEDLTNYSLLNDRRMQRLDKKIKIQKTKNINRVSLSQQKDLRLNYFFIKVFT